MLADRRRQERRARDGELLVRPGEGRGLPDARSEKAGQPLYVREGAAFQPDGIDHFQVMTFGGELLVEVDA